MRSGPDEVYRLTQREDGHFLWCDLHRNDGGDNIDLVKELEPGTSFPDAVFALAGGAGSRQSVAMAKTAPAPQKPLSVPLASDAEKRAGRRYLAGRGIGSETIAHAEKTGLVQYVKDAVLFCGRKAGAIMSATRRAILASEKQQKRDERGSNKAYPGILPGDPKKVWIVEGGVDALAAQDMARRRGKDAPTVIISGGSGVRSFLETAHVQALLKGAETVTLAHEREKSPEVQERTDAERAKQVQRVAEITGLKVQEWTPREGVKDMAEVNAREVIAAADAAQRQERQRGHGMSM